MSIKISELPDAITVAAADQLPIVQAGTTRHVTVAELTVGLSGTALGLTAGTAITIVTNANLTGPITSVGNATAVASQTGTGSKFVMDTSPTLVTPILGDATATSIAGAVVATQTQQETGTAVDVVVTPGRQHFHPSAAKCWGAVSGGASPSLSASYNVTSISDDGTGQFTVTIATDFSSANYSIVGMTGKGGGAQRYLTISAQAAGTFQLLVINGVSDAGSDDYTAAHFACFGDQS